MMMPCFFRHNSIIPEREKENTTTLSYNWSEQEQTFKLRQVLFTTVET
jgi:hypothetical protein